MNNRLDITIIYDNNPLQEDLQTDWGFSCLIEHGENTILFDTGDNGSILLDNMKKLSINPKKVDTVFLSHYHHDHTGGLKDFLKINSNIKIYYPQSFPNEVLDIFINSGSNNIPVSDFMEILPGIYSLGEIHGKIPEQSMAIHTRKGLIIITGCAHPGIVNIIDKVKSHFPNEKIYLALGGFHLHRMEDVEIKKVICKLFESNIQKVAPTHCTGNLARKYFNDVFSGNYIILGTGKRIKCD